MLSVSVYFCYLAVLNPSLAVFCVYTFSTVTNLFTDVCRGPRSTCIFYWALQLLIGAMKSFGGLRCAWINNFILALASSVFSFCFETLIVAEHDKVCVHVPGTP
jgi:hypothetical protein